MKSEAKLISSSIIFSAGIIGLSISINGIGILALITGLILLIINWNEIDLKTLLMGSDSDSEQGEKQGLINWIKNYDKLENRIAKEDKEDPKK